MLSGANYEITELLFQGSRSRVWKGHRKSDNYPIVIKYLADEQPSLESIARFNHEYDILKKLHGDGTVAVYDFEEYQGKSALVLEHFGISLKQFLVEKKITLKEFLILGLNIIEALEQVHQHNIIHKDINPANILLDDKTLQVKIIDFGIATTLSREVPEIRDPHLLQEGTLPYISPEQTGRMNRGIDYRTDYYSLGVTLYQIATGILPFQSNDPAELVHCHIAKLPASPNEINPTIPLVVSNIIMKLLAKTPEERYQSSIGLKADFKNCLEQLESTGKIKNFPLATQDISTRLHISQKLYGREEEIMTLQNAFERISKGNAALIMLAGNPGIGKTTLVHELHKSSLLKSGYFISGKFDQLKHNIPYFALVEAFQEFIQHILILDEDNIRKWQTKIQQAIGEDGKLVTDVVPMLTTIIGEQPPIPSLPTSEIEKRFNRVFINLIQTIVSPENPLVIFLDDCQWADISTFNLLEKLVTNFDSQYFLIICAYRDNEVNEDHILMTSIEKIRKQNITVNTISILPLKLTDVEQMIADTLHTDVIDVKELAEICFSKTHGNPFFLNQFIYTLYNEDLLKFDLGAGRWIWDINKINQKNITDNVVELMAEQIQNLSPLTQNVLKIAACVGNHFDLQLLAMASEKSTQETAFELWEAQEKGLIFTVGESYQDKLIDPNIDIKYQFVHDRVHQAAISLLNDEMRKKIHLKIGRLLLMRTPENEIRNSIFEVVDQIDNSISLVTDRDEKQKFARLNLIAGQKAKQSIAYQASLGYFQKGLALLEKNSWRSAYQLTQSLYGEAVSVAFLANAYTEMNKYYGIFIHNVKDLLDKIPIYEIYIYYLTQNQPFEALKFGFEILKLLGVKMPAKVTTLRVLTSLITIKIMLRGKKTDDLFNMPELTDPYHLAVLRILRSLVQAASMIDPKYLLLINLTSLKFTLKHGNSPFAMGAYAVFAYTVGSAFKQIELSHQYIQLAMKLMDTYKVDTSLRADVLAIYGMIIPSYDHFEKGLPILTEAYQLGLDTSNLQVVSVVALATASIAFYSGRQLNLIVRETKKFIEFLQKQVDVKTLRHVSMYLQAALNLSEQVDNPIILEDTTSSEDTALRDLIEEKDNLGLFIYYALKTELSYFFNDYKKAYEYAKKTLHYKPIEGYMVYVFYFFDSLIRLSLYKDANIWTKAKLLKKVSSNQKKLLFAGKYAPMNYQQKYYLVEAELAKAKDNFEQAAANFDKAISLSKENKHIEDEALANERAALFYLEHQREKIAKTYLNDARYCYLRWGANSKVKQLTKDYDHLLIKQTSLEKTIIATEESTTHTSTTLSMNEFLDLSALMKSAMAISGEIILPDLLKKTMRIVIENAGAQKGFLLLETQEKWNIEAQAEVDNDQIEVLQSIPITDQLPATIIQYVIRTKSFLSLGDATKSNKFTSDPYIQKYKPKSILCFPLLNQGVVRCVLYMENNLTYDAFTEDRISLLNLLSGQIIIAIDNARLYAELKALNLAYESFVPKEFLNLLEKKSIIDLKLGDQVQKEMTVMFCDIRGFTTISEKMTPQETISFINSFFSKMEPVITQHAGVIDKYIGDAIMALYPAHADDALQGAIAMLNCLREYNKERLVLNPSIEPISIGIGLNTGILVLGTVGDAHRMEGTVISDAVNTASRIQGLTKTYLANILITDDTYKKLKNPERYAIRKLGTVFVKGKTIPLVIYEVFDNDNEEIIALKQQTNLQFKQAIKFFQKQKYEKSLSLFKKIIKINPKDSPARAYCKLCEEKISELRLPNI